MKRCLLLAALLLTITGCGGYQLSGVVLHSKTAGIFIVDANDSRLNNIGVGNVVINVTIDPTSLGLKKLPKVLSDEQGRFSIPVDEVGAGVLEYEARVLARRNGYRYVEDLISLPSKKKRLLILMEPGRDTYKAPDDPIGETLRSQGQFDDR